MFIFLFIVFLPICLKSAFDFLSMRGFSKVVNFEFENFHGSSYIILDVYTLQHLSDITPDRWPSCQLIESILLCRGRLIVSHVHHYTPARTALFRTDGRTGDGDSYRSRLIGQQYYNNFVSDHGKTSYIVHYSIVYMYSVYFFLNISYRSSQKTFPLSRYDRATKHCHYIVV